MGYRHEVGCTCAACGCYCCGATPVGFVGGKRHCEDESCRLTLELSQATATMEAQAFRITSLESKIMELEMQLAKRAYKLQEAYDEIKRLAKGE